MQDDLLVADGVPLSQGERVLDTYVAPSKTFLDLRRDASWWLPCILILAVAIVALSISFHKVGVQEMQDTMMRHMPKMAERIESMPADQQLRVRQSMEGSIHRNLYVIPISMLISSFLVGALYLATANFVFGGKAKYWQMVATFWYSLLPFIIANVISSALVLAGVGTENYNLQNPLGTNLGYYMDSANSSLVALLTALDVFSIWVFALQVIGISKVARISTGAAFGVAIIWWVIYTGIFKLLPTLFM